jgi:GT2 family glycosyltransferase
MSLELSIVIPCFNGVEYTAMCLESIARHTPEPHEVILVDNGSTDGTGDYFAGIHDGEGALIRNPRNQGFGMACNQGLAVAEGRRVMVLNNDTIVTAGWFTAMNAALERDPSIGVAVPRSNHVGGLQILGPVGYGGAPSAELDAFGAERNTALAGAGRVAARVTGLCMTFRREVIETVGGFDPVFRLGNFEDDDYSLRTRLAGYALWICDDSYIHHFGHRTFATLPEEYRELLEENGRRFQAKWDISLATDRELEEAVGRPFDPARDRIDLARWAPSAHAA